MAGYTITGSQVAGVSVKSLRERLKEARGGWWSTALKVAAMAAAFIPAGFLISMGVDRIRNGVIADRQNEVLADHYKSQVANTLGIDPEKVNIHDLRLAARVNPMVRSAIDKVMREKDSANRSALLGNGAVGALTLGGVLPGINGLARMAIVDAPALVAGNVVSSLFDKDVLMVHDVMEHLDAKQHAGEAVTAQDVLLLRIAQSEDWQKAFAKQYGMAFHKMNEAQQRSVINVLPSGTYAEAQESATKLANGQIKVADLLTPSQVASNDNTPTATNDNQVPAANGWVARTGGPRTAAASHVERVGRAAAPASFVAAVEAREAAARGQAATPA